jgi:hypothetical protein
MNSYLENPTPVYKEIQSVVIPDPTGLPNVHQTSRASGRFGVTSYYL